MTPRLYVETNFLVGYAKEHHEGQDDLLALAASRAIDMRVPAVAIMEAYKSWERERERTERLRATLQDEINDVLRRKYVPEGARDFADLLDGAAASVARRLDQGRARTAQCIQTIATSGTIIALPVSWAVATRDDALILSEPDDMILASVLHDAATDPSESILLTENSDDFGRHSVKEALSAVNIRYMYDTASVLSRITSLIA